MNCFRRITAFILFVALLAVPAYAAGDADDPVVSQSYLESVFKGELLDSVQVQTAEAAYDLEAETLQAAAEFLAQERLESELLEPLTVSGIGEIYTAENDLVTVCMGTKLTVMEGVLYAYGTGLVDITSGAAVYEGAALLHNHTYISADDSSGYKTASVAGGAAFRGEYTRQRSRNRVDYGSRADALAVLGLFKGGSNGYELCRTANRTEALVMFLRILGLEDEALATKAVNPFTDVPSWAAKYAAYAYEKGLVRGTGGNLYNAGGQVTAHDYMTFLMRALGYQENTDFSWSSAVSDAVRLNILTNGERNMLEQAAFSRAQMVYLSWQSLMTQRADHQLLLCSLLDQGVMNAQDAAAAIASIAGARVS